MISYIKNKYKKRLVRRLKKNFLLVCLWNLIPLNIVIASSIAAHAHALSQVSAWRKILSKNLIDPQSKWRTVRFVIIFIWGRTSGGSMIFMNGGDSMAKGGDIGQKTFWTPFGSFLGLSCWKKSKEIFGNLEFISHSLI